MVLETTWVDQVSPLHTVSLQNTFTFSFRLLLLSVSFQRQMEPLLILAIGKSIERFLLLPIGEDDEHNYFRKNGVHFVPKVRIEDLLIWTNQK